MLGSGNLSEDAVKTVCSEEVNIGGKLGICGALLGLGLVIGLFGSFIAMGRYLKV